MGTYTTAPHPLDPHAVDLLMHVGAEYTVPQYIREAKSAGVSKRIPATSIPNGVVPGVSRLFLWHSQVLPLVRKHGMGIDNVTARLIEMDKLSEQDARDFELLDAWSPAEWLVPSDYVPMHILHITCIIQDLKPDERRQIERDFEIEWQGACFSWSYLGRIQCVVPDGKGEDDIPENLRNTGKDLDFVHVKYTEMDE